MMNLQIFAAVFQPHGGPVPDEDIAAPCAVMLQPLVTWESRTTWTHHVCNVHRNKTYGMLITYADHVRAGLDR